MFRARSDQREDRLLRGKFMKSALKPFLLTTFATTLGVLGILNTPASAEPMVSITIIDNNLGDNVDPTGVITGTYYNLVVTNVLESAGQTGVYDVHLDYFMRDGIINWTGQTRNLSYNMNAPFDPPTCVVGGICSDTLSITFTGHDPTQSNPTNTSLDLQYRSGNTPALGTAFEGFFPGQPGFPPQPGIPYPESLWTGDLLDAQVTVIGPFVPEPSTWAMLILGFAAIGLAGYYRRRSTNQKFSPKAAACAAYSLRL
jgi:PEP-CTERM motif